MFYITLYLTLQNCDKMKKQKKKVLTEEMSMSLYRHWIWANLMKKSHDKVAAGGKINYDKNATFEKNIVKFFTGDQFVFMFIWCGLVFAMCEAFKNFNIIIPEIQKDIDDVYDDLKQFRNAIFHVHNKFLSNKLRKLIKDIEFLIKVTRIHEGIGRYLDNEKDKYIKLHKE